MQRLPKAILYKMLFAVVFPSAGKTQNKILWGGGISAHLPTNGFGSSNFGFKDVAKIG